MSHSSKNDAAFVAANLNDGAAQYEIHDGARVVDRSDRRSDVMRAAKRLPLGTTCGRAGESVTFVLTEQGWLFTGS